MDIVICGAGQVGTYAAEIFAAAGHNCTVVDTDSQRLRMIEDTMDVGVLTGGAAGAEVLQRAGAGKADVLIAATHTDEVNLLAASVAKGLGARQCIARIHHRAYLLGTGLLAELGVAGDRAAEEFDYARHLGIDRLICPELATSRAIARVLRNPGALAIEEFARGRIEMQEFVVSEKAAAIGRTLAELSLPPGVRVAAIRRPQRSAAGAPSEGAVAGAGAFLPKAATVIHAGDTVVLVGNVGPFAKARKELFAQKSVRQSVAIMGGPPMAVWLCRALRGGSFSIRLFETDQKRAEELAEKLPWVTVINANPTDLSVFEQERLAEVDTFVALVDDDEHNILGSAWVKSMGAAHAIAVVQKRRYLHLLEHVGIDKAFSPRAVAVKEIESMIDRRPVRALSSLAEGVLDVYRVRIGARGKAVGAPLKDLKLRDMMVVALQEESEERGGFVPGADDRVQPGQEALVIGPHGIESAIAEMFVGR